MKPGVYIHIPFCEQRCYYCAFTVAVAREETYEPYVRRLIREIELSRWSAEPETIFLGGGTPSILAGHLIQRVLESFPRTAAEISLEANPGTLDSEKLRSWRESGVNRVSLGAQSFHDDDLRAAGRIHQAKDVFSDFELLRSAGFQNINIDLIAGLPDQRDELWRANLDCIARLQPEQGASLITLYNLYPAAELDGAAAPGFSQGQAIATMRTLAAETLPDGFTYEWTTLAFQQLRAGSTAVSLACT